MGACALLLGACTGIPKPFSRDKGWLSHTEPASPPVSITTIDGAPKASVDRMASQLYTESRRRGFTATMQGNARKTFTMTGQVTAAPTDQGTTVFFVWDVVDPTGKHRHRVSGEEIIPAGAGFSDPWDAVDDSAMQRIASRTAEGVSGFISQMGYEVKMASVPPPAAMLLDQADSIQTASIVRETDPTGVSSAAFTQPAETPGAQESVQPQPPSVQPQKKPTPAARTAAKSKPTSSKPRRKANAIAVPMVVGAKGRGNEELASAMRRSMARAGVPVVKKQRKGAITIAGEVKLDPPTGAQQMVRLSWRVLDQDGTLLGTITQKNKVPAGSLDAGWGQTAGLAAQAAAGGIFKLLSSVE